MCAHLYSILIVIFVAYAHICISLSLHVCIHVCVVCVCVCVWHRCFAGATGIVQKEISAQPMTSCMSTALGPLSLTVCRATREGNVAIEIKCAAPVTSVTTVSKVSFFWRAVCVFAHQFGSLLLHLETFP